jgi:hypothetical protein
MDNFIVRILIFYNPQTLGELPHLISDNILIQEVVLHALHEYPHVPDEWTNE